MTPAAVASDKYCNNRRLKQRSSRQIGTEIKLLYQIILLAPRRIGRYAYNNYVFDVSL